MGRFATAAREAGELTNKQLGDKLSTLTVFNRESLKGFLPSKRDKNAFIELMKQVEAETDMDRKIAYLKDNIQSAGKVVFSVLKAFL